MIEKTVFLDPAISRKSHLINSALQVDHGWPMPSIVEISESGTCNRVCSFCPRSNPDYPDRKEFIHPGLLKKLVDDLAIYNYQGIVLFSGFVEPLLDKKIYQHIKTVHTKLPKAKIEMVTNGDVLTLSRLLKLFESGLSTILISVYDGPEAALKFENLCKQAKLTEEQAVIRHRYLPESDSFGITLSNRAGMMENAEFSIKTLTEPLKTPCNYPHYTFFVDYQGDVLLCPHDWGKKRIAGNLTSQSFKDIWLGPVFDGARKKLAMGDRRFQPCNLCDVQGSLMGGEHLQKWGEYNSPTVSGIQA